MPEEAAGIKPPSKAVEKDQFPQYPQGTDANIPHFRMRKKLEEKGLLAKKSMTRAFVANVPVGEIAASGQDANEGVSVARQEPVWLKEGVRVKMERGNKDDVNSFRPDALRRTRQELIDKIKITPKKDREPIVLEGRAWDELSKTLLASQQEVHVDMGELGEQMARFVVLTPPESRRTEAQSSKPPIFLIPGISMDLELMGVSAQELAFKGRTVVMIAFPESWKGEVTDTFGKETEDSRTYEPHTTFFKKAIEQIRASQQTKNQIGDAQIIDLWGYSAGSAIIAEMLTDPKFRQEVANATLICPASSVDQNALQIAWGAIRESWEYIRPANEKTTAERNVINRQVIEVTKDHRRRMKRTFKALSKKVSRSNKWWEKDMQVREGGKITVVSYDHDELTRAYKIAKKIEKKPNLTLVNLPGTHETWLSNPDPLIDAVG